MEKRSWREILPLYSLYRVRILDKSIFNTNRLDLYLIENESKMISYPFNKKSTILQFAICWFSRYFFCRDTYFLAPTRNSKFIDIKTFIEFYILGRLNPGYQHQTSSTNAGRKILIFHQSA